jgi:dynein heavy chain, axonemal
MTMMFEVEDLAVASPATVSRCGMVYMEPEDFTLELLVKSWMKTLPEKVCGNKFVMETLTSLFASYLASGCYFMRKNCPELVETVDNNLA